MLKSHQLVRKLSKVTAAVLFVAAAGLTSCKGMLDITTPGSVAASTLLNPGTATLLVSSTQADFECAYSSYVYTTATWADEMQNASGGNEVQGWSTRIYRPESGTGQCPTAVSNRGAFVNYLPLQITRGDAENALTVIGKLTDAQVPGRNLLLARAALYDGFVYVLLGEVYCQVVLDQGPVQPPSAALTAAVDRFTKAIGFATTANDSVTLNAAYVGRARAELDLNKLTDADADAKMVPKNFVFNATYDVAPVRRVNDSYENNVIKNHLSVDPAYRNLTVGGVPDPRVVTADGHRFGADAITPIWIQMKYTALNSPIPLATWDEAQLIIADAEGGANVVTAINNIRAKYNLPMYAGGTSDEIKAQIIEERRRTLFYNGHRMGDMLRYGIPFLTGVNQKGVKYNNDARCILLPFVETIGRPTS